MGFQVDLKGIGYGGSVADPVLTELRRRVRTHLDAKISDGRAGWKVFGKGWLALTVVIVCHTQFLFGTHAHWSLDLCWSVTAALGSLFLIFNWGHEAVHGILFRSARMNQLAHSLVFGLLGVSSYLWQLRHNHSHHTFPNVNGCDADIDENPVLRLSPNHPRRTYQRYQHWYALPAYAIVHLHLLVYEDWLYLRKVTLASLVNIRHSGRAILFFVIGKVLYFCLVLGLPLVLLPYTWPVTVGIFLATSAVVSLAFVLPLIGTHFNDLVQFPQVDQYNRLPGNFLRHQVDTCLDWSPHGRWGRFLFGGLNSHLTHHLLPNVSHEHFRELNFVLEEVLVAHGIESRRTTFVGCVRSHFRFLSKLARPQGEFGSG